MMCRLRQMPQNPAIVASKTEFGAVNIFNTKNYPSSPSSTEVIKTMTLKGHEGDGYGLEWSSFESDWVASGGNDARVCVWNVNANYSNMNDISPVKSWHDRQCIIEVRPLSPPYP